MAGLVGLGPSSGPLYVLFLIIDDVGSVALRSTPGLMIVFRQLDARSLTAAESAVFYCNV